MNLGAIELSILLPAHSRVQQAMGADVPARTPHRATS